MDDYEYWLKKRMEDIPEPITVGQSDLTEEEIEKGKSDLRRLMKKYGILKNDD